MGLFLTIALSLPHVVQAMELKGVLDANRLVGSDELKPTTVAVLKTQRCGPGTQELVLTYADTTAPKAKDIVAKLETHNLAFPTCDTSALQGADGALTLTFAYKIPKNKVLQYQSTTANQLFMLDHWIEHASSGKAQVTRKLASEFRKKPSQAITIENLNDLAKIESLDLRSFNNFESPYRDPKVEKDLGLNPVPLKGRSLEIPLLQFQLAATDIDFEPMEFPFKEFQLSGKKYSPALQGAFETIVEMIKREDWIRASSAHELLMASKLGKEYKNLGFVVPALSGYLKIKASQADGAKENRLFLGGVNEWRETLVRQAVAQEAADSFLDFMYLESLRYLYNEKDFYTGLSLIDESKGIKWSPAVLERSDYLQGVALLSLGMRQKAKEAFGNYIEKRKNMNIRDVVDRRLLPSAAFRSADVDFAREDYALALQNYQKAMDFLPGSRKVNLEGYIYPRSLVAFPQVLFNMAEAHLRTGDYAKALKRLRALIAFDVAGANHGVTLYRIGEILAYLGSDPERVLAIFRECSYRYNGYLSGNLCEMRAVVSESRALDRAYWPRLEAIFSKFEETGDKLNDKTNLPIIDRKVYSSIVKASFYLDRERPLLALGALDSTRDLESAGYLRNWNYEYSGVALVGALREYLVEGDYRAVVDAYEKRRKTQFLYLERSGVVLAVAQAYAAQGLWPEAQRAEERALQLKTIIARTAPRPYDFTPAEWSYTSALITVGLYEEGQRNVSEAQNSIKELDDSHLPSLLLLIGFAQKSSDLNLEIKGWQRLAQISKLDWSQVRAYSSALLKTQKNQALRAMLEQQVGRWFYDKDKGLDNTGKIDNPGSVLLLRLAEARVRDNAKDSGLRVYEFLAKADPRTLDPSTPRDLILYSMGKAQVSKKDYESARRSFDAATALAPTSVWGRLAATESQELVSKAPAAQAR